MAPTISDAILHALAPGIALNSAIFYNSSLQNRFLYITARCRELNAEARKLHGQTDAPALSRLASIRRQVAAMTGRARTVRRAIVLVYSGLCCFILTILTLLAAAVAGVSAGQVFAVAVFGLGFLLVATASLVSIGEMALSQRTLDEDIRSTFEEEPPA